MAQLVKNLPAMQGPWVWPLGWEDPLEKGMAIHTPLFWPGEFHELYNPWGCKELDTTERLSLHFMTLLVENWTRSYNASLKFTYHICSQSLHEKSTIHKTNFVQKQQWIGKVTSKHCKNLCVCVCVCTCVCVCVYVYVCMCECVCVI